MSRYSGPSICKEKISPGKNIIKCSTLFTIILSTDHNNIHQASYLQQKFQRIIKSQPNIYFSLCLHRPTQAPDPLRTLTSPRNPTQYLLRTHLIWSKLNFPLQSKNYLTVLMITIPSKMQNSKNAFLNKMKNLMQHLRRNSKPCHFRSKMTIKILHQQ